MKLALLRTIKILLVLLVVVFLLMTCTFGAPPWTCADWTGEERRQRVAERLHKSMATTGRKLYAGFTHFEFYPDPSGGYQGGPLFSFPRHWTVYLIMKGEVRPDQGKVAFLHCNGGIEFSNSD